MVFLLRRINRETTKTFRELIAIVVGYKNCQFLTKSNIQDFSNNKKLLRYFSVIYRKFLGGCENFNAT